MVYYEPLTKTSKKDAEKRRDKFLKCFDIAKQTQEGYAKKWREYEKVYEGNIELPEDITDLISSKLKIPWAWQQIETIIPRIMDPEIRMEYRPVESGDRKVSDALNILINAQLTADNFILRQRDFIQDAMVFGLGVGKVRMHQRKQTVRKVVGRDEEGNAITDSQTMIVENRPSISYVDPYDFFWDPAATNDQNWNYVFHRSWLTKAEMKQREEAGLYKGVDDACQPGDEDAAPRSDRETAQEAEARRAGKYEVLEGWFSDGTRMVVCNGHVLHDGPNPYYHGQFPFICFSTQPTPRSLVGVSEVDKIKELLIAGWIKDNQRIDILNYALNFVVIADPNIPGVRNLKLHPGKVIHAVQGQRLEQWALGAPAELAFAESESYIGAMQQMTGATPMFAAADLSQSGIDNTTATGASIMQEEGNKRMAMKKLQFRLFVARAAKMMAQLNHQYLTPFEIARILGDSAENWKPIAPEEIPMFMDVVPEAMSEVMGKMVERNSLIELLNIVGPLHGTQMLDGTYFDSKPLLERAIKAYDQNPYLNFRSWDRVVAAAPPNMVQPNITEASSEPGVSDSMSTMNEVLQ